MTIELNVSILFVPQYGQAYHQLILLVFFLLLFASSFIHSFIYMNRSYDTLQCNLIGSHVSIVDMIDITLICRKLPHQCPTRLLYIQLTMNTVQFQTLCSVEMKKKKYENNENISYFETV